MNTDPEVMEFFVAPPTREESDAFVDRIEAGFAEHGFGVWAVEEISTGAFIGFTGLLHQTFEAAFTPAFEIGYRFARHAWGQGYATEAVREAVRFAFERAGLVEIVSRPSRIHTVPSPMTTSQCHRAQGSRSSRAGMLVVMRPVSTPVAI